MLELGKLENDYKNPVHMDDVFDFSSLYITYDNYIRVSGESQYRTDFVASFGFGMGWMSEDLNNKKYKDETLAFVMKLGFTGETVVEGLGWDAGLSIFALDVEDNEKLQGAVSFDIGVKYTF